MLAKLWSIWYNNNISAQISKWMQATKLFQSIFYTTLPHPQEIIEFKNYRMIDFIPQLGIFDDRLALPPDLVLTSLDWITNILIDHAFYEQTLPLLCLANYVATDIVKSIPFSIKFRVHKVIVLARLGYIKESILIFHQIVDNKDKIVQGNFDNFIIVL